MLTSHLIFFLTLLRRFSDFTFFLSTGWPCVFYYGNCSSLSIRRLPGNSVNRLVDVYSRDWINRARPGHLDDCDQEDEGYLKGHLGCHFLDHPCHLPRPWTICILLNWADGSPFAAWLHGLWRSRLNLQRSSSKEPLRKGSLSTGRTASTRICPTSTRSADAVNCHQRTTEVYCFWWSHWLLKILR